MANATLIRLYEFNWREWARPVYGIDADGEAWLVFTAAYPFPRRQCRIWARRNGYRLRPAPHPSIPRRDRSMNDADAILEAERVDEMRVVKALARIIERKTSNGATVREVALESGVDEQRAARMLRKAVRDRHVGTRRRWVARAVYWPTPQGDLWLKAVERIPRPAVYDGTERREPPSPR